MKDTRRAIRSTEWQMKDVRSDGRPKRLWRDDIMGQQGTIWTKIAKDRESRKTFVGCCFLQWKNTA